MDVLKTIAYPPSAEHYHLLLLMGALISVVFTIYFGFLLGASFLAYRYERKGRAESNLQYGQLAKDLIGTALYNKTIPTFLGLIPAFSLIFVYTQLLQATDSMAPLLALGAFLCLLVAVAFLYAYKYTFRLGDILEAYRNALNERKGDSAAVTNLEQYSAENVQAHLRFGRYGIFFVLTTAFLISSSIAAAGNSDNWTRIGSLFDLFITADVYVRFFQFVALAAGVTGIGILYFLFSWRRDQAPLDQNYADFVRKIAVRLVVGSLLAMPVLVLVGFMLLPGESLSGTLFGVAGVGLALLFLSAQYVYAYSRDLEPRHAALALFVYASALALLGANDQVALYNVTKNQAALLAHKHEMETEDLRGRLGIASVVLTGEDIFNGKCSACHLFDQKKIGPAYKDILPKYAGSKEKIVAFVLNPIKMDPAYPPMPNQGLKPAEADSVVAYILKKLGMQTGQPNAASPQASK